MAGTKEDWVTLVRRTIKQSVGRGWSIREKRGNVELTRRFDDGTRSTVVLDMPWSAGSVSPLLSLLKEISERMDKQSMGLKEAYAVLHQPQTVNTDKPNWDELFRQFKEYKVTSTGDTKETTFERMYQPEMRRLRTVLTERPAPRNAKEVLSRLRDHYGGAPGSRGRKQRIQYAAQFLRFVVNKKGLPERWLPPDNLTEYVGKKQAGTGQGATPIRDHDIRALLMEIKDPGWRHAIGLLACFGLRPVELQYCRPSEKQLYVFYEKRTARGSTEPGHVVGLDPEGMPDESLRLLAQMQSGEIRSPVKTCAPGEVGQRVGQYLRRNKVWERLTTEYKARGEHLTPYSFRHSYARRASEAGFSLRVTATMMRHSPQTHNQHYATFCDDSMIQSAAEKSKAHTNRMRTIAYAA